jgi:hypothetical protein
MEGAVVLESHKGSEVIEKDMMDEITGIHKHKQLGQSNSRTDKFDHK